MSLKLLIGHMMIGNIQLEQKMFTHFVLFNKIFHDKDNLLKIPAKHLEMIKDFKEKHLVELLPKKWQKTMKEQIEQHLV